MKHLIYIIAIIALAGCGRRSNNEIPVSDVRYGTFYLDLYEEGEISATNSINIVSPNISWRYGMLKITQMVDDGEEVQAGDTLVVFDPTEIQKAIVDSEASLEMKKAELEKLKAEQQSAIEELEADLEITRISQQISRIQFESASYEAEIRKKEIELNLERANIALERANEQLENRKKIQAEEMKQKMLEITQARNQLNEALQTLEKLHLVTSSPGIAIINRNWSTDNKFQEGDQCWSGYPLIDLPDLNELKATVQINEVDISKIKKGLRVEIKPDAFSDSTYNAEIISVANLAVNKDRNSRIKVFPVEIVLKETNKNLLPGLTVSCRIIIDQIDDVLFIPLDAVHQSLEGDFVYLKTATGFIKRDVTLGQSNTDFVIIEDGLSDKDKVALINPFAESDDEDEDTNEQNSDV
jgi:multidrug efflux pump subunit AcrA (membrane-fusion protein)